MPGPVLNTRNAVAVPIDRRPVLSIPDTCALTGFGRTLIYEAINDHTLIARKRGKRTVILRTDLDAWLASLEIAGGDDIVAESDD